ncbi:MAG: hypothetical protein AB7H92_15600 [Microbacteriaceae bacterium]
MGRLTDHVRVQVATAYAKGDLDDLRVLALAAIDALDQAVDAYDTAVSA